MTFLSVKVARFIIAILVLLLGSGIVAALFWAEVPTENKDAFILLSGIVLGWGSSVIANYFGDSESSTAKDATISDLSKWKDQ